MTTTAQDLASNLWVAANTRQQYGATQAQIDYIVRLCTNADGSVNDLNCTTLTKFEASMIIDSLLNPIQAPTEAEMSKTAADKIAREEETAASYAREAAAKEWKAAWISENHPDYENRSKKSRKNIRSQANKAYNA